MALLFDFISLQDSYINGGSIYAESILEAIIETHINLYGVYDSSKKIQSKAFNLIQKNSIELFDINNINNINNFIKQKNINKFFICISQRYDKYDLTKLDCNIFVVCHDVGTLNTIYFDKVRNKEILKFYGKIVNSGFKYKCQEKILELLYSPLLKYVYNKHVIRKYQNFQTLINQENVTLITDSNFSKYSLMYFFNVRNTIKIYYPPLKKQVEPLSSQAVQKLVENKKYFLLISAERKNKNIKLFLEQWDKFSEITNYQFYAIILGKVVINKRNIITIKYVTTEDLEYLYKNSFAFVYPSLAEGFGYPPIEAMKYGKPIVCTNATSLPEICGNSALFFSPFYPEDLFMSLLNCIDNYDKYSDLSYKRYLVITQKQKEDLKKLMDLLK